MVGRRSIWVLFSVSGLNNLLLVICDARGRLILYIYRREKTKNVNSEYNWKAFTPLILAPFFSFFFSQYKSCILRRSTFPKRKYRKMIKIITAKKKRTNQTLFFENLSLKSIFYMYLRPEAFWFASMTFGKSTRKWISIVILLQNNFKDRYWWLLGKIFENSLTDAQWKWLQKCRNK